MKCEEASELFSDYETGSVEPALALSFEHHLVDCATCRDILASLKTVWNALDDLETVEPPLYFHENLMSRINAAVNAEQDALVKSRAAWNWRQLFQPRSLAYAALGLVICLAGMGELHYTKASLDPIGSVIHLIKPSSTHMVELAPSRAEWRPNTQGTGDLVVYLKAKPEVDGKTSTLNCVVNLPVDLVVPGANTSVMVNSDTETTLTIPMKGQTGQKSISITLNDVENGATSTTSKSTSIPIMWPLNDPKAN